MQITLSVAVALCIVCTFHVTHVHAADAAPGEKVWELTNYLKGTAPQIRDLLNGDLERLIRARLSAKQEIADCGKRLQEAESAANERLHARPRDIAIRHAVEDADHRRALPRESSTPQERLQGAGEFAKQKQELEKYERDALATDEDLLRARKAADDAQERLMHCESSLLRAYQWRERLIDATRNSFVLDWPLRRGQQGLLGTVAPVQIDRTRGAIAFEFRASENIEKTKEQEGIVTINVLVHRVEMVAVGVDTGGLKVGQPVTLDRTFEVAASNLDSDFNQTFVVKRVPGDLDRLFELISQLREPISTDELAELAKAKAPPAKNHPKTWSSLATILAAAPTSRPAAADRAADRLDSLNDWLDAQIVGDKLETFVTVDEAAPQTDGVIELRAHIDSTLGKTHTVICSVDVSAKSPIKTLKPNQKVHVLGTIKNIRALGAQTLFVQLDKAKF